MSKSDILRIMDEAAQLPPDGRLRFNITGGEPFLDFDLLLEVVAHGLAVGAVVTSTTNAYWAHSAAIATDRLTALQAAGLRGLAVSVSRFHQSYVSLSCVKRVLEAARRLSLPTELKGAITNSDLETTGALATWKRELDADFVNIFPILPYVREGAVLADDDYYRLPGLPQETCPNESLCVEPDGNVMSCCGPGVSTRFLSLGSVHEATVETLQRRLKTAPRQQILREHGPVFFARAAIEAGREDLLRKSYAGPCDLCAHIAAEPQLRRMADAICFTRDDNRSNQHKENQHDPAHSRPGSDRPAQHTEADCQSLR